MANIISAAIHDRDLQTRIYASIDLAVNLLSLATQVFITGQGLKRFGTGIAAGALPGVYVLGFVALLLMPTLAVVVTLQIVQRWMNFAIANPARQVFFYGDRPRGKIQSQESDRCRGLSRLRCFVRLGVRRLAGAGHQAGRYRLSRCRARPVGWRYRWRSAVCRSVVRHQRKTVENGSEELLTKPIDFLVLRCEIDLRVERAA
jgi:hypothetical protein